ncbi:MAG: ribonuclease H-like domain-containing protein [Candidatus Limnocylindrales bacterium]
MTAEPFAAVTRERRLANLRATMARAGGPPAGPDQLPARAPFAGRRSGELARRLASALGADAADTPGGWLVRRVLAGVEIPLDRQRLARLPGHPPPDAPLVCLDTETTGLATAAGTLAFLVGLARWEGTEFRQTQLLLPDHADEPALLAEIASWVTPDAWLVTYNGRGFDWPLIEARFRLAGRPAPEHAGHLDLLPFVRRVFKHRMEDARLRTVEERLLGVSRIGDVEGWEIPGIYLDVLRGGPVDALAGVVIHNEKDVRSLGLLLAHVERRYAERSARRDAPRGDLAGLARAYGRDRRHDEALDCLDDALAAPAPVRDPFGRTPVAPAGVREAVEAEREAWWAPGTRPHFGGRPPRAGWRGDLANGRGGPLGPAAGTAAWDVTARWTDERLAAERARVLRRLGRWSEAAEAWQTAAASGGGLGAIAWIEVAKLREHHLGDPAGALAATRAAWRLLERSRATGRPYPRVEADLQRRGARLQARIRRGGRGADVAGTRGRSGSGGRADAAPDWLSPGSRPRTSGAGPRRGPGPRTGPGPRG